MKECGLSARRRGLHAIVARRRRSACVDLNAIVADEDAAVRREVL